VDQLRGRTLIRGRTRVCAETSVAAPAGVATTLASDVGAADPTPLSTSPAMAVAVLMAIRAFRIFIPRRSIRPRLRDDARASAPRRQYWATLAQLADAA
jgi:hypothetical protein